ncbi:thiamine biosynthesis protein [Desulfurivibrio dismutans]|uniref:thiamine biosynthesis protein n=1 Tax=Desulfurivibrio dismutans TaxID=1398908 RepID=UPI0023DB7DC2|nr:thiamine biosynthesis protein [Desulfurivibrio alkaliphilus]MDF1614956.1 tRNA 4-thiouridine(8) synthase ThiI [Desulfurivibrio alkaliphilus]
MTTALALYSGGLDSTLACRVIMEQNIRVVAVKFVTPFFGADLLKDPEKYQQTVHRKYGIEVILRDLTEPYLRMLARPAHGYGKNFNPCVDCKIMLMGEAKRMLAELGADFLISGEVLGQRPMSQRRDTLRVIERDSGCADLLLRPLCARNLPPTKPEREGLVDRGKMYDFKGRSRTPQMKLAEYFGISDYESPGGGCVLTDPNLAQRIRDHYVAAAAEEKAVQADDILLLLSGRIFQLPGGSILALGRTEAGNQRVLSRRRPGDWLLNLRDDPGPLAVLRPPANLWAAGYPAPGQAPDQPAAADLAADLQRAAALVLRYAGKAVRQRGRAAVEVSRDEGESHAIEAAPARDEEFIPWRR